MEGEEKTIPLSDNLIKDHKNLRYNHAILLEDDEFLFEEGDLGK